MIAEHLSVEEVAGIKEGFQLMDTSNKGKINIDELRVGLRKLGHQISDADVQILMEAVSITRYLESFLFVQQLIGEEISSFVKSEVSYFSGVFSL